MLHIVFLPSLLVPEFQTLKSLTHRAQRTEEWLSLGNQTRILFGECYQFARAAVMKYHRTDQRNKIPQTGLFVFSQFGMLEVQNQQGWFPLRSLCLVCRYPPSCCLFTSSPTLVVVPLCMHIPLVFLCILMSSYRDMGQIGLGSDPNRLILI